MLRSRFTTALTAAIVLVALSCSDPGPTDSSGTAGRTEPSLAKGGGGSDKVRSISISPSTATVAIGATLELTATAKPADLTPTFVWSTSNAGVANVDQRGVVTGVGSGTATISASADGKTGRATITVAAEPPPPPPGETFVLVGAGDIADCNSQGDEQTAAVVSAIPGTVFLLGDNAYESGTAAEYNNCYNPTWGAFKNRTKPTPGNHEYLTLNAAGYFGYFGDAAGDPTKGYYSYDLGDWHIIVLNSSGNCFPIGCGVGSVQEQWLRADLAATTKACILAYWHHPRFSSGQHGNNGNFVAFWNALYEKRADIVLNGHDHNYERFAPQRSDGTASPDGIRQFVVGTGGRSLRSFGVIKANSEARESSTWGVLKLTLRTGGYDWQFVPVTGKTFTDSGSGTCH